MKEILRMVFVLGVICGAAGLALGGVYSLTKEPIEYQQMANIQGPAVESVLGGYDNDPIKDNFKVAAGKDKKGRDAFKTIFPALKGGEVVALALAGSGKGFDGNIDVMVGVNPAGNLTGIAIMKHTETPGIGSKITEAVFTDQFAGKTLDSPTAVDAISGATYSTKGVFAAVETAVKFYQANEKALLAQAKQ